MIDPGRVCFAYCKKRGTWPTLVECEDGQSSPGSAYDLYRDIQPSVIEYPDSEKRNKKVRKKKSSKSLYRQDIAPGVSLTLHLEGDNNFEVKLTASSVEMSLGWASHFSGHDPYETTVMFERYAKAIKESFGSLFNHLGI